ncbi:MAG: choice-of-anchor P family protein [Nocardioides sp.]|nr:choice-of-anchor P family protein [Nocardioides sp.]
MRPSVRLGTLAASAGLIAAALAAAPVTTSASPASPAAQRTVKTNFALFSTGYGTLVQGGALPAGSDGTAYSLIGCTTRAGLTKGNYEAEVTVPGLGTVSAVRTRLWTEKKGSVVSSYSTHRIAEIIIAEGSLGKLSIEGVRSMSRAFHDGNRFRTQTETQVARIVLTPTDGEPQVLDIPTPGQPIVVPGLASIAIGNSVSKPITDGIRAAADALNIHVIPTDTRVRIAHTATRIQKGAPFGTFRGYSAGVRARALADNIKVGRTPLSLMPCKGTKGQVKQKALAHVNLGDQAIVRGLDSEQMGRQRPGFATGYELGNVAKINLGDGQLVVKAIVGKANVTRKGDSLVRNAKGSRVGEIVANGRTYSLPPSGVLEIPGIAKLEEAVVRRIKNGISVIGLRITVLDGSGAVIDLGLAELRIRKG